jgi:hypothetical protein
MNGQDLTWSIYKSENFPWNPIYLISLSFSDTLAHSSLSVSLFPPARCLSLSPISLRHSISSGSSPQSSVTQSCSCGEVAQWWSAAGPSLCLGLVGLIVGARFAPRSQVQRPFCCKWALRRWGSIYAEVERCLLVPSTIKQHRPPCTQVSPNVHLFD